MESKGNSLSSNRFREALEYSANLHAAQKRKGSPIPYLSHLLSVAALVLEDGGTEDEAIAALLHDSIEDQGRIVGEMQLKQEIRARFGEKVLEIVEGCTDGNRVDDPPWKERKERYLSHLKEVSPSVRRVATADKLHNARCILMDYRRFGDEAWKRFKAGKEEQRWYYRSVVAELCTPDSLGIAGELRRVVEDLEKAAERG